MDARRFTFRQLLVQPPSQSKIIQSQKLKRLRPKQKPKTIHYQDKPKTPNQQTQHDLTPPFSTSAA